MKNSSKSYRLFSLFMAILVAVSISLPSALLAAHCDMDSQQSSKSEMIAEHCPHMEASSSHANHSDQNEDDCNLTLSCACDLDQQQIKAEVIPAITETAKLFFVSAIQYVDVESANTTTFFADAELNLHAVFPPLFLLNSVFLN